LIVSTSLVSTTISSLSFGPQMDLQLGAAVVLGDALLASRALDLSDREAREAGLEQIHADRLEGLVPDVRDHHLHCRHPPLRSPRTRSPESEQPPAAERPVRTKPHRSRVPG